jgi:coproporphyrinogen III oxidase
MEEYVRDLQNRIVEALEAIDPNAPKFKKDSWVGRQYRLPLDNDDLR